MNGGEESLAGERLPLWVALALAAFGVIGAVTASQLIAESTADDDTAAPASAPSESNASGSSGGREDDPSGESLSDESLSDAADQGGTDGVAGRAGDDDVVQGADDAADDDADDTDDPVTGSTVAPPADCPPVFVLRFATGSAEPSDVDPTRVADLVAWLAEHPESVMLLDGHADAAGSEEGNLQLSFRRAEAAATLLVDGGASPDLLQARGFGEYQPLPGEAPDSGRNRRVTMQVSGLESCPSNDNPTDEE